MYAYYTAYCVLEMERYSAFLASFGSAFDSAPIMFAPSMGMRMMNVLPTPSLLSTQASPLCFCATLLTMNKPNPLPLTF